MKKSNLRNWFFSAFVFLGLTGCQSRPSLDFGAYSQAENFYEKQEYAKAIAKYEEYVRENPEGNMATISYYYMAKSYEALGQPDKARALYEKIAKGNSNLIWVDFAKARLKQLSTPPAEKPQQASEAS